ncbi:MAG: PEP-CTERM sorting domain-containing protein [Bythopirellula sp.]|nr:PEP-CTERM sorting domain-containing protein [Bythopirellula sp.]
MRNQATLVTALLLGLIGSSTQAQTLEAARDDQINRLKNYVLAAIQPSGLVRDSLVLNGSSFHPASPDAAGFALLGLSALNHVGQLPDAEQRVINILSAHAGQTAGVNPDRSADGHFLHWMNLANGSRASGGWPVEYTSIGSALLVAGAQFARNHFPENPTIASLTDQLTNSINFNAAIHPNLGGGIYLKMNQFGGGLTGTTQPWNEYMLVESLALREADNERALAIKDRWLDTTTLPKRSFGGIPTLTDNASSYAPAFWVQQMHFFNGDFRHSTEFETFFENQQQADALYSSNNLGQAFRYGLTAGVSPQGYSADEIGNHPNNVFSPEAVAAWGDMDTFLEFYNSQFPTTDPRYKYGLVRESATQPTWVPNDAGLVDHLFLLFGLVESIDPDFFADRVFPGLRAGDFDYDGDVDGRDFLVWQRGDSPTAFSASDLADWQTNYGAPPLTAATTAVPEPATGIFFGLVAGVLVLCRWR